MILMPDALKKVLAYQHIDVQKLGIALWNALSAGGGGGLASTVTVFNDAAIKLLPTTTPTLIPALGANILALPVYVTLQMDWIADYTNIDANSGLNVWTDVASFQTITGFPEAVEGAVSGVFAGGSNSFAIMGNVFASDFNFGFDPADLRNDITVLAFGNGAAGNLTGGNAGNVLTVTVFYTEVTLP